jgi:P27 family predicted phage terminase small subunit
LHGNPGKRPFNENEPQPEVLAPDPPDWLDDDARKEWDRITPILLRLGLLTQIDLAKLASYCTAYSDLADARRELKKFKSRLLVDDNGKFYTNPLVAIARAAKREIDTFGSEFGMSPASRTRIQVNPPSRGDDDKARFFDRS